MSERMDSYQVEVRLLLLLPARISQLADEPCQPCCMFAAALLHPPLQGICSLCHSARSCLLGWSCIVQLLHQAALEDGDVTGTRNNGYWLLLLLLGAALSFCQWFMAAAGGCCCSGLRNDGSREVIHWQLGPIQPVRVWQLLACLVAGRHCNAT